MFQDILIILSLSPNTLYSLLLHLLIYYNPSRQIAVFGLESMGKLVQMNVLIVGLKGLGVEIGTSFFY